MVTLFGWCLERVRDREAALGQAYLEGRSAGMVAAFKDDAADFEEVDDDDDAA
jgi:hypothetical protein